jgi:serine protease
MNRCLTSLAALAVLVALVLAAAPAASAVAANGIGAAAPAREFAPHRVILKFRAQRSGRAVSLPPRVGVRGAVAALRRDPRVAYAAPDYLATASARTAAEGTDVFDDSGSLGRLGTPGNWVLKQWNFLPWEGEATPALPTSPGGIDAVGAWRNLIEARRPGAIGVTVAVLDTGIAYRSLKGRFRRSPDFATRQFVKGYDFVAGNRLPFDRNGHGTHVAGTIAEQTGNGVGLTGLAYGAKLMPIRVLDRRGTGQASTIAQGIRFAVDHGADVINMSFNFECGQRVPWVNEELRRAYRRGVVTVASIGNRESESCIAPPATGPRVIAVGGTTEGGCLGEYALSGRGIDVVAPGGGPPLPDCPSVSSRPIYQVTFAGAGVTRFGEPGDYVGTSMAAAHVSGVAAMILASRVARPKGPPRATARWVLRRLRQTARSLGLPATRQGAGLIDAERATDPSF